MAVGLMGRGRYLLGAAGGLIIFLVIILDERLRRMDRDA
jgi:hypothetical protein